MLWASFFRLGQHCCEIWGQKKEKGRENIFKRLNEQLWWWKNKGIYLYTFKWQMFMLKEQIIVMCSSLKVWFSFCVTWKYALNIIQPNMQQIGNFWKWSDIWAQRRFTAMLICHLWLIKYKIDCNFCSISVSVLSVVNGSISWQEKLKCFKNF